MKLFFRTALPQDPDTRGSLLQRTLRQYCASSRQSVFTEVSKITDASTPVSVLESLSAFPRAKTAPLTIFEGLVNAPEAHLGRNVLVCAQSLQAELASFAARNRVDTAATPMWWKNLLRNYEQVILLDRYHLAQSNGFAPWARLSLANYFPVLLGRAAGQRDTNRILLLNHDPEAGAQEVLAAYDRLSRHTEVLVLSATGPQADLDAVAAAAIHIHYGYAAHLPPGGLTPYDSLSNGVYTVVLPAPLAAPLKEAVKPAGSATPVSFTRQRTDLRLIKEIKLRSYALLADSPDEMLEFVESAIDRLTLFASQKLALNPELQRYDRMNEDCVSTLLGHFTRQVAA